MKLNISQRLIGMILVSALALIVGGFIGYINVQRLTNDLKYTHDNLNSSLDALSKIESNFLLIRVNGLYHTYYDDAAKKAQHETVINEKIQAIESLFGTYEKQALDAENLTLLKQDQALFADYVQALNRVLEKSRTNEREAVDAIIESDWKPAGNKLTEVLIAHRIHNQQLADQTVNNAVESGKRSLQFTIVATAIGVGLMALLGWLIRQSILSSLQTMRATMLHVAGQLDFTARVELHSHDEIGIIAHAFNQLLDRMQDNIRSVATGAEQVAVAASQVAQTSAQIAASSQNQSESAASMSATVEQMTVSIGQVSGQAEEVHNFSSKSGELAHHGEQAIHEAVQEIHIAAAAVKLAAERIHQLESQSEQISSVIAVIREVADQTNLLALNAAIEAARAGEQGRGFAVVADEVRKLAERTASSTTEIAQTIESMRAGAKDAVEGMQKTVQQVGGSVEKVGTANQLMQQIGSGSRNGVAMVNEIVNAIQEQSSASNSIANQIEKIAQMAEEGSCAAHEGYQSAKELDQLAVAMQKMVAAYSV